MYHVIVNGNNPHKKLAEKIELVKQVFHAAERECEVHITDHAGHARELAASLTEGGKYADLVAMGGDGTLHEILNGIADPSNCSMGIIPLGTGNDFAAALSIPGDVRRAAELIAFRFPSPIDYIELDNGLRSINAVGAGIDVDALKRAYSGTKKGKRKYLSAFLKSLKHYKCTPFKVSWDGGEEQTHFGMIACLGNGRQIGGGIKLFPDANVQDGYMDLVVVDYLSKIKTLFAFLKLVTGRIYKVKRVTHVRCKTASFTPLEGEMSIQAEGEIYDGVPLNARIAEAKLKFYLP